MSIPPLSHLGSRRVLGGCISCALALSLVTPTRAAFAQSAPENPAGRTQRYGLTNGAPRRWTLDPKPLLEIGGAASVAAFEFSEIRGATRLSDGRIAVANGATNEIRLFRPNGGFERALGRSGAGPGEFTRLGRLLRTGDTLVGADGDSRAQAFGPDGLLIRSFHPLRVSGVRNLQRVGIGVGRGGNSIVTGIERTDRLVGSDTIEVMVILRGDGREDSLSTLFRIEGVHIKRLGPSQGRVLLDAEGTAVARDGRICAGYSADFNVVCYDAAGSMIFRIVRETRPRSVTETERALVRAAYLDANRDAPPAIQQQMRSAAKEFMFASRAPAFSRLMLSTGGELWVSQFDPATNLPGRPALLAPREPQRWNVFDTDGRWLAEMELPARFVPYDMERDVIIGVSFDSDDVERVTLYRLRR